MQKISTVQARENKVFKARQLTIGVDLGDRSRCYCVLDDAGEVILERSLSTTPKALTQVFGTMSRSRIVLETGAHSPWVRSGPAGT